ncbi:TAXI family TRAP transporter solute-binding subunit [Marinobacterium sp. YM272]|uniref:TAXI family TRAP transporter solute-binding subunit n=1 Tax=Marinobacterium sp. YM272 TaxID=3421654 RepID=UPI003D7F9256
MNLIKRTVIAGALSISAFAAQAQSLSFEGAGSASLTGIVPQSIAPYAAQEGVSLQVVLGQSLTKSIIKVAAGRLDLAVAPPPAINAMKKGVGPYKNTAEQAKKLSGNLRALFGFSASVMHSIVWADSDIQDWKDIKDKRVFIGPPAGAAAGQTAGMLEQATGGYKAGTDYEGVKIPWGSAMQAFQDGQFDLYVGFYPIGAQSLNELSLQRPIRILSIGEDVLASKAWADYAADQVIGEATIPPNTYSGQVNGDQEIHTGTTLMSIVANAKMDDDTAYKVTKAFWENLDTMKQANALMKQIDASQPFTGVNVPLHPGAVRYYQEKGIEVPENLL